MREPVDKTPVWMMRQAGRYLPEYKKVRAKAGDFLALCHNAELACEVTIQPLERFALDAAIIFSDILTIPDAMGQGLYFEPGEGPKFRKKISTPADVKNISPICGHKDLGYVMNALKTVRHELNGRVPLIGFSGSPWTLATYMIEGGSTREFRHTKTFMLQHPEAMHTLLDKLSQSVISYLNAQILSGAQVVQLFDTWGGVLTESAYQEFSLAYMKKIIKGVIRENEGRKVPFIVFTKGGGYWLEDIANIKPDCIGLDWSVDIGVARQRVGQNVSLQGNMDPAILFASPGRIRKEVSDILTRFGHGTGHIFNLGHGVSQYTNPEHVKVYVDAVHEYSQNYHQ
jgi:uroporphyrinogen decarboxylase